MTPSELAKMCDCEECQCIVCFDKPPKKNTGADKPQPTQQPPEPQPQPQQPQQRGTNKNCCCKGDCVCDNCPVELLAKLQASSAPAPLAATRAAPIPTSTTMSSDHPEDCDCAYCLCPNALTRNIGTSSPDYFEHSEDCDCDECSCPQSTMMPEKPGKKARTKTSGSKLPVKISKPSVTDKVSSVKPPGCTCGECICPGRESALRATGDRSFLSSDCDCPICACPGAESLRSVTPLDQSASLPPMPPGVSGQRLPNQGVGLESIAEGSPVADCDCIDCQCNPCADPKRRKGGVAGISPCDCPDCKCDPCADPNKRRDKGDAQETAVKGDAGVMATPRSDVEPAPTASTAVGSTENKATHPPDCICEECLCQPEEKHESGCSCPECKCMDCFSKKTDAGVHAEGCQCSECICSPCDKKLGAIGKRTTDSGSGEAKPTVRMGQQDEPKSEGTKPVGKSEGCTCDVCKCEDCFTKSWGPIPTCTCAECICVECLSKGDAAGVKRSADEPKTGPPVAASTTPSAIQPAKITRSCHCLDCVCDVCTRSGATKDAPSKGCTCEVCQCADCGNTALSPSTMGKECECPLCDCKDCPKKEKPMGVPATKSVTSKVVSHPDDCICDLCVCTPENASDQVQQATAQPAQRSAMVREPDSSLTDPPPFEVPIRKACTCGKCECPECNKGGIDIRQSSTQPPMSAVASATQRMAATRSLGVVPLATAEAPPFEVPVHVPCTCGKCDCSDCNKSAGQPPSGVPIYGVPSSGVPLPGVPSSGVPLPGVPSSGLPLPGVPSSGVPPTASIGASMAVSQKSQPATRSTKTEVTCDCQRCDCSDCNGTPRQAAGMPTSVSFATSEGKKSMKTEGVCNCQRCDCADCNRASGQTTSGVATSVSFAASEGKKSTKTEGVCNCQRCDCTECGGSTGQAASGIQTSVSFATSEGKKSTKTEGVCNCQRCDCTECNKKGINVFPSALSGAAAPATIPASTSFGNTSQLEKTTSYGASPSMPPSTSFGGPPQMQPSTSAAGAALPASVSFAKSQPSAMSAPQGRAMAAITMTKCDCPTCTCAEEAMRGAAAYPGAPLPASLSFGKPQLQASIASAPQSVARSAKTMTKCDCPTCTCAEERAIESAAISTPAIGPIVSSRDTGLAQQQAGHTAGCTCPECCACPVKMNQLKKDEIVKDDVILSISKLGNEELMRKIKTDKEENCKCREQIKELRRALDKIKCSCSEAEMKAIRSTVGGKPFIKQASTFGQTMSGLKFALNNLQEKCKAKDKLIEVMTGELKMRTSSNTFDKVLNTNGNTDVPDYDKAGDIKPFDRLPDNSTNILFPVNEEREIGHTSVRQRSSDISGHKHKKKSKLCKCGKQHKDKDNTNVDLTGFEVVDIRRITQDSIIIKWKPPQSSLINGYDIFVNGVNKSKVMSGGRTSAMVHSLDLSSTIQITIYAVTKCGRCEPPAIAIYEINAYILMHHHYYPLT